MEGTEQELGCSHSPAWQFPSISLGLRGPLKVLAPGASTLQWRHKPHTHFYLQKDTQTRSFGEKSQKNRVGCYADGWPGCSHGTIEPPGPGFWHQLGILHHTRPRQLCQATHGQRAPQNPPPITTSPSSALPFPISRAPLCSRRMLGKRCVCGSRPRLAASPVCGGACHPWDGLSPPGWGHNLGQTGLSLSLWTRSEASTGG